MHLDFMNYSYYLTECILVYSKKTRIEIKYPSHY